MTPRHIKEYLLRDIMATSNINRFDFQDTFQINLVMRLLV